MKALIVILLTAAAFVMLGMTVIFGAIFPLNIISLALCAGSFTAAGRLFDRWSRRPGLLQRYRNL